MKHHAWLAAAVLACAPPPPNHPPTVPQEPCIPGLPPVDEETEHLLIFNETGGPICPGTLRALDLEVERLADELGLPLYYPIPFYYGIEPAIEMCDYEADAQHGGCTQGLGCETFVASSFVPQVHELVHAIRRRNGISGPAVLEEGLAVVLGDGRPIDGVQIGVASLEKRSMLELVGLDREEIPEGLYSYGAHFLSFAIERHGLDAVMNAMADDDYPDDLEQAFEASLGVTLTELDGQWRGESWEQWYGSHEPCGTTVALGEAFETSTALACEDGRTLGSFEGPLFGWPSGTCLSITEPVDVSIVTMGGPGSVTLTGRDCEPNDVEDPELVTGLSLPAPVELDARLARCTWWVYFRAEWNEAPTSLMLRVEPR